MQPIRTLSGSLLPPVTGQSSASRPSTPDTVSTASTSSAPQQSASDALTPPQGRSWMQRAVSWTQKAMDATTVEYCAAQLDHRNQYPRSGREIRAALAQVPAHERQPIVALIKRIYPDNDSRDNTGAVISALAGIPSDERTPVIELAQQLLHSPRDNGFARTLTVLGHIDPQYHGVFAACAESLFRYSQTGSTRAGIMEGLAKAPAPQWAQVTACTAQILSTVYVDQFTFDEPRIVALMAPEPENQRDALAECICTLSTRAMSVKDLAYIGDLLVTMPADRRAAFVQRTQTMFHDWVSSYDLIPVVQALGYADPDQLMDVVAQSLEAYKQAPAGSVSLLGILNVMTEVAASERPTLGAALVRFAQVHPVGPRTKDLMAALRCIPAEERLAAVDALLRLPSPPEGEWLADAWLVALRHIPATQRASVVELIRRCVPGPMFWYDLPTVAAILANVATDDHNGFVAFAEPYVSTLTRQHFTDSLGGLVAIQREHRALFSQTVQQLVPEDVEGGLNPAEHGTLLTAATQVWPNVKPDDSAAFAAFARRFLNDKNIRWSPTFGQSPAVKTLNALSRIPATERAAFADFAARLSPQPAAGAHDLSYVEVHEVAEAWNRGDDRQAFAAFAEPYLNIPDESTWKRTLARLASIAPQDRAKFTAFAALLRTNNPSERAFNIVSLWDHLAGDDRVPFAQFARPYIGPQTNNAEFLQVLRSLNSLAVADRAPFSDFTAQLLPANGSARLLQDSVLVIELARVLPDNRPHVISRCQPMRQRYDYRTWVRRAADAGAVPDFDAAWRRAGWDVATVDRENVMNAARQNAANAAEAALYAQYPDYTDPTHDLDGLKQHLEALHPSLQVGPAEQTMQWQSFAQHMQAFSSDDAVLQQLAQAMQHAPASARVPAAWIDGLKEFPKKPTSYRQNTAPEFMHQFYPGEDATPLASWLGHLNQFAFVDASAGFPQSPRDKHLEAFTKHVRQFEAATIPALARVRGATRATELTNAQRIFCAVRGTEDVTNPINTDSAFAKLCGLIWHIVQNSPETARRNDTHSLIWALAQCMEDDNYSVCGIGRRQRLVAVLEAQGCTPGEKLAALAEQFDLTHPKPQPAQVEAFMQSAMQEARDTFGEGSRDMQAFAKDLAAYVEMTYRS